MKTRIIELTNLLNKAAKAYYVFDNPIMTDEGYDYFYKDLKRLEELHPEFIQKDSPTQSVGYSTEASMFSKIKHISKMYSLKNAFTESDLDKFLDQFNKNDEFVIEPKLDGLAINLIYKDGILVHALTRGDGEVGEEVLDNVKTIKSIPQNLDSDKIPKLFEVRGEILLNKQEYIAKFAPQKPVSGRNLASGAIRQKSSKKAAERPLLFFSYGLGNGNYLGFKTYNEEMDFIKSLNIPTTNYQLVTKDKVIESVKHLENNKPINTDCDGVVIRANHHNHIRSLGHTSKFPRYAIAKKPEANGKESIIKDVKFYVGKSGLITAVADIKPVEIDGTIVSKVNLHNQEEIVRLGLTINSKVAVKKAGEIIPKIFLTIAKDPNEEVISYPKHCPSCNIRLLVKGEANLHYCTNAECKGQLIRKLEYAVSRPAFNIVGLSTSIIESLVEKELVSHTADLYKLTIKDLSFLGKNRSKKIFNSIQSTRNMNIINFIRGLNIPNIGITTSEKLVNEFKFKHPKELYSADYESSKDLTNHEKSSIGWYFLLNDNCTNAVLLINEIGDSVECPNIETKENEFITNKQFVITGTLPVSRTELSNEIKSYNGKVSGSVSKNTDVLITNDTKLSTKLKKAKSLNIPIWTYETYCQYRDGES